ncbi:MAG: ribosomal protein [Francisellaceae bacterium]|nr:ribosomal protein [Francisellaceae bacterium]
MKVILLEKVQNLGDLGKQVTVKKGYGRNFLIPTGKAVLATEQNLKMYEEKRAELEKESQAKLAVAQKRAESIQAQKISIAVKTAEEGRLFGSIAGPEIVQALKDKGIEINRSEVRLPNGPLRQIGDYEVEIHLHTDVNATLQVSIIPEA